MAGWKTRMQKIMKAQIVRSAKAELEAAQYHCGWKMWEAADYIRSDEATDRLTALRGCR